MKRKRNPEKYLCCTLLVPLILLLLGCSLGEVAIVEGEIYAETIVVRSGTSGNVEKMEKGVGDRVDKGELILRVGLKETEERLERERERLEGLKERIKKAKDDYEKSEGQVKYSKGRYLRNRMLFSKGAIAEKEVVRTREEYNFAETLKERAKNEYEQILGEIERVEEDISRTEMEYGSIFVLSPETGFITKCFVWEDGYLLKGDNVVEIAEEGSIVFKGEIKGKGDFALGDNAFVIPVIPMSLVSGLISGYISAIGSGGEDDNPITEVTIRLRPETRWDILSVGTTALTFIP